MSKQPTAAPISLQRLPKFAVVGAIGFLIDAAILTLLMNGFGFGPYGARAVSFATAVTATWYLNRRWVFSQNATRINGREYTSYMVVQFAGATINLMVFILIIELLPKFANIPIIPLAVGAIAALTFNFIASSKFVFTATEPNKQRQSKQ